MTQPQMEIHSGDTAVLQQAPRYVRDEEVRRAIEVLRSQAVANGVSDMSMDEIDAVIAECRREQPQIASDEAVHEISERLIQKNRLAYEILAH